MDTGSNSVNPPMQPDQHSDSDCTINSEINNGIGNSNSDDATSSNKTKSTTTKKRTILNEAHLLVRDRCVNSNQSASCKRQLELLCEEKISQQNGLERVHCSLPSSIKSTFIMTFSPDGRKVASTHGDHCIYICDLNTGKLLDTLYGHPKTPWCLAWHPSNKDILASGCLAGEVRVWDLNSKAKAPESWTSENNSIISSLDFHPKERLLVIATANDILFWDWGQPRPFAKTTTTHDKEKVKFVEFDSSGTRLITGISNLPRFSGYSSDSLQNRIIDNYLTPGSTLEPSHTTENMTQNSDTLSSNNNERLNDTLPYSINNNNASTSSNTNNAGATSSISLSTSNNNEQTDFNQRSTLTLSRIAYLYRQLEALEDSMRHTTFAPYSNVNQPNTDSEDSSSQNEELSSQPTSNPEQQQHQQSSRASNTFEPFVVSFDESLENLQLSPLVIDGQTINLATILEQYPIEFPNQVHFMMHYESINQVNQNFIRISKLMSSIRLYRQVVQQITTSNSNGSSHFQPNQILTAQSTSMRSPRSPIIFRNLPMPSQQTDARRTDPVMAIQFRSSARNVPLVTICKIDLLGARSVCIMRSQQLIEQAIMDLSSSIRTYRISLAEMMGASRHTMFRNGVQTQEGHVSGDVGLDGGLDGGIFSFYHLLSQLHQSLTAINHAPLTTSNVHTHILSLRTLINRLISALTSLLPSREEGERLSNLVHDIAHSLTGRSWSIPLGASLDDIRLDVIHTMCIVDLSLHLARQIQLLQMHRLSAMARIEEHRSTRRLRESVNDAPVPGTSRDNFTRDQQQKRKNQEQSERQDEVAKRRRVDNERGNNNNDDIEMIDTSRGTTSTSSTSQQELIPSTLNVSPSVLSPTQPPLPGSLTDSMPVERLIVWNSSQGHADEQSLQRFLVATAASMNNSHILVRIYHRANGNSSNMLDAPGERIVAPIESRRRALSQDNNSAPSQDNVSPPFAENARARYTLQNQPPSVSSGSPGGYETWHRAPHFHVIHARGPGQHLWFNQWTISLPLNSNYRLQCWKFSLDAIPNIKDSQSNIVTQKCRIMNDSSIDLSSDGSLLACLVPREDGSCMPSFDLKVFSLKSWDFGTCYHQIPHGTNAISVSLSPTASYAVVGLASLKYISNDPNSDDLTIAKVFNLSGRSQLGYVRDIKIKRDDSSLSLNAITWMPRGIVYNVGPQHHQRYQTARMRNRFV